MGKTPGKWIKTVLFGKKSSKSNFLQDVNLERNASLAAKALSSDFAVNPPVVLDPALQATNTSGNNSEFVNGVENLPSSKVTLLPGRQGSDGHGTAILNSADSDELNRQQQAATKAQAAFRGYLARRAFWALKGIIRLQALVRGHLVRRQAVATLQCMQSIVKFQALVRGRIVRLSYPGREVFNKLGEPMDKRVDMLGVNMFLASMNQSANPFIRKLLASSPTAMPLSLQYDLVEPNSAWNWLERWSSSYFWVPLARPKKILDAKPKRRQANMQTEEIEATRPKRSVRKVPAINGENSSLHSSEYEKPRRNPRKVSSHQAESAQEQPQNELERVKRNLRKVSLSASLPSDKPEPVTEKPQKNQRKASGSPAPDVSLSASSPSDKPEPVTEKPQQNQTTASGFLAPDVSEQVLDHTTEKSSDSAVALSKQPMTEAPLKLLAVDKQVDIQSDNLPAVEVHSLENSDKVDNSPKVNEGQSYKEDQTSKENRRTRRRKSLPVKQEYPESVSQNAPALPSYMLATESAKAKLRAQESQKIGDDEVENGFTRRHSLPASTNVKVNSPVPRMQKPLQANGKGGSKSYRSLTSSRDEKFLQAGWKR